MVQILQHRRNTTTGLQSERGSVGEIIIDTTKNTVVVMDGVTNGGSPLAKESDIPVNVSDLVNDTGFITSAAVFSGSYNDLTNRPTLFSGAYADLTGKPTLFSGDYDDLTNKPTLFDGQYSSLSGIPTTFAPSSHTQAFSTITSTPTTLAGYGIVDAFAQGDSSLTVGNTHNISAVSDTVLGIGPNDVTINFGTALQNFLDFDGADIARMKPTTEFRVVLGDSSEWVFAVGGGLDFPDFTTQTTAWTGNVPGLNYSDPGGGGSTELSLTADVFDFGTGNTVDLQGNSVLFNGATVDFSGATIDWVPIVSGAIQTNGLPVGTRFTHPVPATSKGASGDVQGAVAFDGNYIYYCTATYSEVAWANIATVDIAGGNGVDSGIAVTLDVAPSIGWSISDGTTTSTINQVVPQATWYVIFWDDSITFDIGDTVYYGATAPTQPDIWKRVAWSGDTW